MAFKNSKVIALAGPTEFKNQFLEIAAREILTGNIIPMYPPLFGSRIGADIDIVNV